MIEVTANLAAEAVLADRQHRSVVVINGIVIR